MSEPAVRALAVSDAEAARVLVRSVFQGTRHLERSVELLELALTGSDRECLGLVCPVSDGSLDGVILYGTIEGAPGVIKIHDVIGATVRAVAALINGVCDREFSRHVRMVICELSRAPEHALARNVLTSRGFTREASIEDYYADGAGLDILVLRAVRSQE